MPRDLITPDDPDPPDTDETVDAVDDLGWDPEGNEPISDPPVRDGLRVEIPPGTYLWDGAHEIVSTCSDYAFVGTGDERADVEFRAAHGADSEWMVGINHGGRRVEIGNFVVNWTDDGRTAGPTVKVNIDSDYHLHDILHYGCFPASDGDDNEATPTPTPEGMDRSWQHKIYNLLVRDADGVGLAERCDFRADHTFMDGHTGGEGLCVLHQGHEGHAVFRDCHWVGVNGDAAVYGSGLGMASFFNVRSENCEMGQFRAGGPSQVVGCTAIIDNDQLSYDGKIWSMNGILWAGQNGDHHGGLIRDTEFVVNSNHSGGGQAIRLHDTANDLHVHNVSIEWNVDVDPVIFAYEPGKGYGDYDPQPPYNIEFTKLTVKGSGNVDEIFELNGRPGSVISGEFPIDHNRLVTGTDASDLTINTDGPGADDDVGADLSTEFTMPTETSSDGDSSESTTDWRTFQISGDGERAAWSITVDGQLEHYGALGSNDSEDTFGAASASGVVLSGSDGGRFTGAITNLAIEGAATVYVDGEEVDPAAVGTSDGADDSDGSDAPDGGSGDGSDDGISGDGDSEGDTGGSDGETADPLAGFGAEELSALQDLAGLTPAERAQLRDVAAFLLEQRSG